MSWNVQITGTRAAVAKAADVEFDKAAKMYEGREEAKDVLFAKERVLSAITEIDTHYKGVKVEASGSRGSYGCSIHVAVQPVTLALDEAAS